MAYVGKKPKFEEVTVSKSSSGATVTSSVANTANAASSKAVHSVTVAGASADDAVYQAAVSGVQTYSWGVDNSASDAWVLSASATLGTTNAISVSTAGVPTLTTPILGVATATSLNGLTVTSTSGGVLTIANSKTLTVSNTLEFTGTDATSFAFPATSSTVVTVANAQTITAAKTFNDSTLLLAGSSSGTGTLKAPAAASTYVWTLPAATGTLADLTSTQTLDAKTLTGVAGITLAASAAINWAAGAVAVGASIGANAMTLGGASSTIAIAGKATVADTTDTTSTSTGAVQIAGGLAVTKQIMAGNGILCDDDTSAGGATALNYYRQATQAATWTWDGTGSPGNTGSVTVRIIRVGSQVTLFIPALQATTGTTSATLTAGTAMPSWARPANNVHFAIPIRDNGSSQPAIVGQLYVLSTGIITISKVGGAAFTNSASAGMVDNCSVTFGIT